MPLLSLESFKPVLSFLGFSLAFIGMVLVGAHFLSVIGRCNRLYRSISFVCLGAFPSPVIVGWVSFLAPHMLTSLLCLVYYGVSLSSMSFAYVSFVGFLVSHHCPPNSHTLQTWTLRSKKRPKGTSFGPKEPNSLQNGTRRDLFGHTLDANWHPRGTLLRAIGPPKIHVRVAKTPSLLRFC